MIVAKFVFFFWTALISIESDIGERIEIISLRITMLMNFLFLQPTKS